MSVIDWNSRPEPWRTVGLKFLADLEELKPRSPVLPGDTPGERMKLRRLTLRRKMASLARIADLHEDSWSRIERNASTIIPTEVTKAKIAYALGVSVTAIWPA